MVGVVSEQVKLPSNVCKSWVLSKTCERVRCSKTHPEEEERVRLALCFAAQRHVNRLSRRAASPIIPSGVTCSPAHGDDRSHHSSRARVFTTFLIETFGRDLLNRGSGVLDVAGGSGYVSACLSTLGIRSTLVDPKHRNHVPKQQTRKLRKIWGLFYCEKQRLEREKLDKKVKIDDDIENNWWRTDLVQERRDRKMEEEVDKAEKKPIIDRGGGNRKIAEGEEVNEDKEVEEVEKVEKTEKKSMETKADERKREVKELPCVTIHSSSSVSTASSPSVSAASSSSTASASSASASSMCAFQIPSVSASSAFSLPDDRFFDRSMFCSSPSFYHCICPFTPSLMLKAEKQVIVEVGTTNVSSVWPHSSSSVSYASLLSNSSVVIGLHPDQATEAIVDFAMEHNKPFAIVPCCVFGDEFPDRRGSQGDAVSSYEDFLSYLLLKAGSSAKIAMLPLEGKCLVIYRLPVGV